MTWVLGLWLAWKGGWFAAPWLHAKLALVLGMIGGARHPVANTCANSPPTSAGNPQKFFRILNEVPTVLMILIVILVVVKPF